MSKETLDISGFTNKVIQNPDGTITKFFVDEGITSRAAAKRLAAEKAALELVDFTPDLLSTTPTSITMSTVEGEQGLNNIVPNMTESLQFSIFETAGRFLSFLHKETRMPIARSYLTSLFMNTLHLAHSQRQTLNSLEINSAELHSYLVKNWNLEILTQWGSTLTHGDYWLNNIIGKIHNNNFSLAGIIDWETSSLNSPFIDFAGIELSIEHQHPIAREAFWKGYGKLPDKNLKRYFAIRQILVWISEDQQADFQSEFYRAKIDLIKSSL